MDTDKLLEVLARKAKAAHQASERAGDRTTLGYKWLARAEAYEEIAEIVRTAPASLMAPAS